MAINGLINIYKEKGYTSHDVVAKLRGILKQKKIGHTGTLDPDATGVLPVCLGNGTKLCDMLTETDKTYQAVLKLGVTTDTQDTTGKVLSVRNVLAKEDEIYHAILSFVGSYHQIPPMYSAIKVDGKKLYELAREGKVIERKAREVMIYHIQVKEINMEQKEVTMVVSCSKGTYIRTLCQDIGDKLLCGGCMKELVRTKAGAFLLEDSLPLKLVEQLVMGNQIMDHIISVEAMFSSYPKGVVREEADRYLYNGNFLTKGHLFQWDMEAENENVCMYDSHGNFSAVYEWKKEDEVFKPVKMFLN